MLTLNTHRGLYRPKRLMYGIASAPAIWQRQMETILQGIPGVSVFLDDIKITGPNEQIHLQRLEEVLKRLQDRNKRLNKGKCIFFARQINYCGYTIDEHGIHKMRDKMDAIANMRRPNNKEVISFEGLVNYYGRFMRDLSTILYPLTNLHKNDVPFKWKKQQEKVFQKVKEDIQFNECLVHYSPELPLLLATDASPYGVGAVLSHVYPDGTERPIQFASQTLNKVQQRYMHVDKEAYAIMFAVKKLFQYLYGRQFTLVTDNQAITKILGEHKGIPVMSALRMQHYATYLQGFDYKIRFRKASDNANAGTFSRLPLDEQDTTQLFEESDTIEINQIETLPLSVKELSNSRCQYSENSHTRHQVRQASAKRKQVRNRSRRVHITTRLLATWSKSLRSCHIKNACASGTTFYAFWRNKDKIASERVLLVAGNSRWTTRNSI